MKKLLLIAFLLVAVDAEAKKKQAPFYQCQSIVTSIIMYNKLMKQGGSSASMNQYRKSRSQLMDDYHDANCRKYKDDLESW